eukprot:2774146-Prymnesium_polylepis.1
MGRRLAAQRAAIAANGATLRLMLEELELVHREEPASSPAALRPTELDDGAPSPAAPRPAELDDGETALLRAIAALRRRQPRATAKEMHALLIQREPFASLPLSAVKRACSKAAKAAAAADGSGAPTPAPRGVAAADADADADVDADADAADARWREQRSVTQDNVHAVLLQLRREWSDDGEAERAGSFLSLIHI